MKLADEQTILALMSDPKTKDKGFLRLMDAYKQQVYWHIRRMVAIHEDAQDILQETFINVYKYFDTFKGDSSLFTWIYRIANNECLRHLNKKSKIRSVESNEYEENEFTGDVYAETDSENSDVILKKFEKAVSRLPDKQRLVFNMRYYDEISYEDMSRIVDTSVNTLKTNYHYACDKIKKYLLEDA